MNVCKDHSIPLKSDFKNDYSINNTITNWFALVILFVPAGPLTISLQQFSRQQNAIFVLA